MLRLLADGGWRKARGNCSNATAMSCQITLLVASCPSYRNTALAMCGLVRPIFRLPYVPLSREQREHGAKLLRAVQHHIPGCKVGFNTVCGLPCWRGTI